MSECLNNIKKSNVSKSFDSLEAWSMQVWWKADWALHHYIDQKQNLRDFGLSLWVQQICGVKWERGAKEILCCKRNQWRLDASIMRLAAMGPTPPLGRGGSGEKYFLKNSVNSSFLLFGPTKTFKKIPVWENIFWVGTSSSCRRRQQWWGHILPWPPTHQTLLVLNWPALAGN